MDTYIISGHGKLPQDKDARNFDEPMTVTLEIDFNQGIIADVVSTLATEPDRDSIQKLLCGYCIWNGIDGLLERIQTNYHGKAEQAIQAALVDAFSKFETVPMRSKMHL